MAYMQVKNSLLHGTTPEDLRPAMKELGHAVRIAIREHIENPLLAKRLLNDLRNDPDHVSPNAYCTLIILGDHISDYFTQLRREALKALEQSPQALWNTMTRMEREYLDRQTVFETIGISDKGVCVKVTASVAGIEKTCAPGYGVNSGAARRAAALNFLKAYSENKLTPCREAEPVHKTFDGHCVNDALKKLCKTFGLQSSERYGHTEAGFDCAIKIEGGNLVLHTLFKGAGHNKQDAHMNAAYEACVELSRMDGLLPAPSADFDPLQI